MSTTSENTPRNPLLQPYKPPQWTSKLNIVPQYRVQINELKCQVIKRDGGWKEYKREYVLGYKTQQLAHVNTPIQRWHIPGIPDGYEVYIKRDDMLGCELAGNKVRKLEFLLADAIHQGCTAVITCGGIQSNHCSSTALAARQLGLQPYLLLRTGPDPGNGLSLGNAFLDRLIGSHIYLVPKDHVNETYTRMQQLAHILKQEKEENAYIIPLGGSSSLSVYGYLEGFSELLYQEANTRFTDIVLATGSGGSTAGLAIGNYLTNSNIKCHGMSAGNKLEFCRDQINDTLKDIGLWEKCGLQTDDLVDLIDAKGQGYGIHTQEELDFISLISTKTGILLDPTYTGKAAMHLVKQLQQNPDRFNGNKILFIHTGGIFSLFDGRLDTILNSPGGGSIHEWMGNANKKHHLP